MGIWWWACKVENTNNTIEVEKCYAHKNKMSWQIFWHCVLTVRIVQHIQETVRPLLWDWRAFRISWLETLLLFAVCVNRHSWKSSLSQSSELWLKEALMFHEEVTKNYCRVSEHLNSELRSAERLKFFQTFPILKMPYQLCQMSIVVWHNQNLWVRKSHWRKSLEV